jgi:hypothetical protein
VSVGQVYLHGALNEYAVVTKSYQGEIFFSGPGFSGKNEVSAFLSNFGPVDPVDLTPLEQAQLLQFMQLLPNAPCLSVGWVGDYDDSFFDEE